MGYVPPIVPQQNLIYGSRTENNVALKLRLYPVEQVQLNDVTETPLETIQNHDSKNGKRESFKKLLSDLTGKGQNINEVI
ncbi:hypothetical protein [Pseudalkalibacillus decolorationis]|uniref:hypothetical protein n=1 Tax=Pseudalkalibacillus decolorationis TaxID=163879 RepID=UPI002148E6EC|nr:hypothetical protein [Pseudalkalibacillus decolorationis]